MKARKKRRVWTATGWVSSKDSLARTVTDTMKPVDQSGRNVPDWDGMFATKDDCSNGVFGTPIQRRITVIVEDV